jgi:hypothetical protein
MKKMIDAFTSIALTMTMLSIFSLFWGPRGRLSAGLDCGEFISSSLSIFMSSPTAIVITLLIYHGIDLSRINIGSNPHFNAWTEILRIPDFQPTAKQSATSSTDKGASRPQSRKIPSY